MLLTILNLPSNVKYSDIKTLVQTKCHIEDLILDNLTPHDKNTKKITIGVSGEDDAATVLRNINGLYMDGRQLKVIWKTKSSDSNVNKRPAGVVPSLRPPGPAVAAPPPPNVRPQASNWFDTSYSIQQPVMETQNPTPVIPPLMNFSSQTAFYQMNQPTYATQSTASTEKVGYPELQSYGSNRYQNDNQNDWSSNNWNQQLSGFTNTEVTKTVTSRWDNPEAKNVEPQWGNNSGSGWNNNSDSNRNNDRNSNSDRRPIWDKDNDPKWSTNQPSKQDDSRDFKRGRSPVSEIYSRRDRDTNRDAYRSYQSFGQYTDTKSRYDSSNRKDGQNSAGPGRSYDSSYTGKVQDSTRSHRDSYARNDQSNAASSRQGSSSTRHSRYDTRSSGHDSSTTRNDRNCPRSSRHDLDQNNARSSRHDSYNRNDQGNVTGARHDPFYIGNDQNVVSPPNQIYGDHVNASVKRVRNERDERPPQNNTNTGPRSLFDRHQAPPAKRSRFSNVADTQLENKTSASKQKKVPISFGSNPGNINNAAKHKQSVQQVQDTSPSTLAWRKQILRTITKRTMQHTCCLYEGVKIPELYKIIRQAIQSRLETRLQRKKYLSAKQMAQLYYSKFDHASHCALIKEAVEALGGKMLFMKNIPGDNVVVDQQLIPPPHAPPKPKQSLPLAQIPGRIPQYPQGDKQIYKRNKKAHANLFSDPKSLVDLMASLPPATKKGVEEEAEDLERVIKEACEFTEPDVAEISKHFKHTLPGKMKHIAKVNLMKRMLPLLPVQVAAFSTPKVHRLALENYLNAYDVSSLKKSKNKPFYLIDCNSIEDHDKLCYKGTVRIAQSMVSFKPFHLIGAVKVTKNDIATQRAQFKSMQLQYFDKMFNKTLENDSEVVEKSPSEVVGKNVEDVKVPMKEEENNKEFNINIKAEQLYQDIKQLHDQINNPIDCKIENNSNNQLTMAEIINDGDFSTDVDFDNFAGDGYLPVGQVAATAWNDEINTNIGNEDTGIVDTNVGEDTVNIGNEITEINENSQLKSENGSEIKEDKIEDIDIADVNEDDLEDW